MSLDLSLAALGDPRWDQAPLRALLRHCLGDGVVLELEVAPEAVHLRAGPVEDVEAEDGPGAPVGIVGAWRSPRLGGTSPETPGLMLPLLVHLRRLRLPAARIQTLGAPHRPVGDFLMRNLFLALSAGARVRLDDVTLPAAETRSPGAVALQLHYCAILKWACPDAAFADRPLAEIADLLVASAHYQVTPLESPILQRSAAALRAAAADGIAATALKPRLLAARARAMAQLA